MKKEPRLWLIIPCYNEEDVLPKTAPIFLDEVKKLINKQKINDCSKILFINDGSKDKTWNIIKELSLADNHFIGISQSRNRGHQNAVLAGLMEAKEYCDIVISIDCDGQDDISAIEDMVDEYAKGNDIVYGVRSNRDSDTWFKRNTAQWFYKFLTFMGVDVIYNHADYRLTSSKILNYFENFKEVNLFLRGMFPLVGFKSSIVYYERNERMAGVSHYPLSKMLSLAFDGITSLSVKPISLIMCFGFVLALISFITVMIMWIRSLIGWDYLGANFIIFVILLVGGIQIFCIGLIGEYIGKVYMEVKARPRYIISERTYD